MSKYLTLFDTEAQWQAAQDTLDYPNVSLIDTTGDLHYTTYPGKEIVNANFGDIIFYDVDNNKLINLSDSEYNITDFPVEKYEPIAICIRDKKTDDGNRTVFMSLKVMSTTNPENGVVYDSNANPSKNTPFGFYGVSLNISGVGSTNYVDTIEINKSIRKLITEDWSGSTIPTSNLGEGSSPACECCWRFSTPGTKAGDWYMPTYYDLIKAKNNYSTIKNILNSIKSKAGSNYSYYSNKYDAVFTLTLYNSNNVYYISSDYAGTWNLSSNGPKNNATIGCRAVYIVSPQEL